MFTYILYYIIIFFIHAHVYIFVQYIHFNWLVPGFLLIWFDMGISFTSQKYLDMHTMQLGNAGGQPLMKFTSQLPESPKS